MRPLILTIILAFMAGGAALSQDEDVLRPHGRPAHLGSTSRSSSAKSSSLTIGIEGGMNLSFFGQTFNGALDTSPLQALNTGNGIAPFGSFFVDLAITDRIGVQTKIAYDAKAYGNTATSLNDCVVYDQYGNELSVTTAEVTNEYASTISYLAVTPLLRVEPVQRLVILVGPTILFRASAEVTDFTQTITDQESDCYYNFNTPEQSKTQSFTDTVDVDSVFNNTRIGLDMSIAYRIPVSASIDLVPRVGYQLMFDSPAPEPPPFDDTSRARTDQVRTVTVTDRFLNSLQAALGLWIRL